LKNHISEAKTISGIEDIPLDEGMVLLIDGVREVPSASSDSRLIQVT
jgi:hypothetical protein